MEYQVDEMKNKVVPRTGQGFGGLEFVSFFASESTMGYHIT